MHWPGWLRFVLLLPYASECRVHGARTGAAISGKMLQKKEMQKMQTFVTVCGTRLQPSGPQASKRT